MLFIMRVKFENLEGLFSIFFNRVVEFSLARFARKARSGGYALLESCL